MEVAVAGIWDFGYCAPISESPLWLHPVLDFGVDEWHMAPVSGINEDRLQEWADPEAMINELRKRFQLVFVTEGAEDELQGFVHPPSDTSCCYVFGRSTWSPFAALAHDGDLSVSLRTPTGLGMSLATNVLFAVLWHRRTQRWQ